MDSSESTASLWKKEPISARAPLRQNQTCDVCVIGAGMAGLSSAHKLAREGKKVIVLEARDVGGGETGQTTAHLASALDDGFAAIERVHGQSRARLAYQSHALAIDEIESIAQYEAIACDFTRLDGYLFLGPGQKAKVLDDELAAAARAGIEGVKIVARAPVGSFDTGPSLLFPQQARFHPLRYLAGLSTAIERVGGSIHTQTRVATVTGGPTPMVRTTDGFEVRAGAVIVATNSPFHVRVAVHAKQAPYRTYAIALRVPHGAVPDALYWDTCDPYHYVRIQADADGLDHLIVGGEDHRTASADDGAARYSRLEAWARARFLMAGEVAYRWSGQVLEPFDFIAFIGKDPTGEQNVYVVTGDSGHGLTHGAIAGLLLPDLIAGRENPWTDLYDPSRKTLSAAREFVHDGLEVVAEYAKWLKPEGQAHEEELAAGEGVVVQRGTHKVALYRDPGGELHERSAVCTHLGCVVRWNGDAKSWDCGCHGSRFAPTGEVLTGPATAALSSVQAVPPTTSGRRS